MSKDVRLSGFLLYHFPIVCNLTFVLLHTVVLVVLYSVLLRVTIEAEAGMTVYG